MSVCTTKQCSSATRSFCYRSKRNNDGEAAYENGDMKFCVSSHTKEAFDVMAMMKRNKTLCDVKLLVGDEVFYAHKLVLASSSPYFKAMFTGGLRECEMNSVTLQGVCPVTMGMLLCFMYTSEIVINEKNVCYLLPAATMFQMNHVIEACGTFLERQLDPCNAIGIADFAQEHGHMDLYRKANDFINQHFAQVSQEDEFLQLSSCLLMQLIKRDELNVRCEKEVYYAVLRWVKHDERNRQSKLEMILSAVRCHYLTPDFINDQIKHCELLRRIPKCREYLIRIFQELTLHRKPCIKQRTPLAPSVIYVVGGYLRHSLGHMECFNVLEQKWAALTDLPEPRSGLGGAFIQGVFYAVGGRNNCPQIKQDTNALDSYDPKSNVWRSCTPMNVARNRVGVGVMDGKLYAVGGCHGGFFHSSVERYNPEMNIWDQVAPMSTRRIGLGVAVVNRLLYAVGGFDGTDRLNTVESYHPERNEWIKVAKLNCKRSAAGVVALDQHLYAVGGYDGTSQLKTVERYNTETNEWTFVASMKSARSALSVAVLDGQIYALGGYDGSNFLSSVEVYDPAKDEWYEGPSMNCRRSGHAAAVWTASCKIHCDV
ncbi:hypothetical protein CHUAL_014188 [Chamberlinius hualienensis]